MQQIHFERSLYEERVFSFSRFLHYLHKQRHDPAVDIKGLASWNTGFNFMSRILRKNFPAVGKRLL